MWHSVFRDCAGLVFYNKQLQRRAADQCSTAVVLRVLSFRANTHKFPFPGLNYRLTTVVFVVDSHIQRIVLETVKKLR